MKHHCAPLETVNFWRHRGGFRRQPVDLVVQRPWRQLQCVSYVDVRLCLCSLCTILSCDNHHIGEYAYKSQIVFFLLTGDALHDAFAVFPADI